MGIEAIFSKEPDLNSACEIRNVKNSWKSFFKIPSQISSQFRLLETPSSYMSRCDYDRVFYRVFCVTLLATAFTFTVILTNVFVDIDGLLSTKEKDRHHDRTIIPDIIPDCDNSTTPEPTEMIENSRETEPTEVLTDPLIAPNPTSEGGKNNLVAIPIDFVAINIPSEQRTVFQENVRDEKSMDEEDVAFRAKRSLDSTDFQFHIKDSKMKNILTNKLANLLEELDAQETEFVKEDNFKDKVEVPTRVPERIPVYTNYEAYQAKNKNDVIKERNNYIKDENNLLHLAMHNILLQGIVGHMDLNAVYAKIHALVKNFDKNGKSDGFDAQDKGGQEIQPPKRNEEHSKELNQVVPKSSYNIESKFFEELVKCDGLQKEIMENTRRNGDERRIVRPKEPKMSIKTVIDIKSLHKDKHKKDTNQKENIEGVIKLIYNGKSVKLNQIDDKDETIDKVKTQEDVETVTQETKKDDNMFLEFNEVAEFLKNNIPHVPDPFITNAITKYFNEHPELDAGMHRNTRLKRHVKVRGEPAVITKEELNIGGKKNKKKDDELYVEIETHFNSKGTEGEKKRQIVNNIISNIQKALHADIKISKKKSKSNKNLRIKKRFQNPLEKKKESILVNKFLIPLDAIVHRESDPISKTYPDEGSNAPHVDDQAGETWKKSFSGPRFLSASKAINSAEMGEIDIDYEKDAKQDTIPQRLQAPLNTESQGHLLDETTYYNLGNLKFYIKESDATGLSVGFNQYLGEPPDEESIRAFTGIDNLLQIYQNKKTQDAAGVELNEKPDSEEINGVITHSNKIKRPHSIMRRSVEDIDDFHSNEYKIVFNNNFLPYDNYQQIFEDKNKKIRISLKRQPNQTSNNDIESNDDTQMIGPNPNWLPIGIDDKILQKELKPAEIFGLADLLGRKKRSMKVKKYTKINAKSKLNRFINTNMMAPKRIFLKNKQSKRNKRQIDKIRIVATDDLSPNYRQHSEENFFLVSDDNLFADRALVGEADGNENQEEKVSDDYRYVPTYAYDEMRQPHTYMSSIFSARSRHNALMSKYPHIFMEEISRSKEDSNPDNSYVFNNYISTNQKIDPQQYERMFYGTTESPMSTMYDLSVPRVRDIVNAISPRANYKLTVKILPKNSSDAMPSGFKEVHTSINKSISKFGLLFSSLLNMSEISKVEKLNKSGVDTEDNSITTVRTPDAAPLVKILKNQQEKMKTLLKQHKKNIDEQLAHLNRDKVNIESYIPSNENSFTNNNHDNKNEMIEVMLPSNPPQIMHLTKQEAGQLITSALLKLKDIPQPEVSIPTTTTRTPKTKRTTLSTTTTPKPTTTMDLDKLRIMHTIQHNENLTHAILTKIDRNTEVLQKFLQKLTERMEIPARRTEEKRIIEERRKEEALTKPMTYSAAWKEHIREPFLRQSMPNLEVDKNDTHVSIPFVYAYQQPYPLPNNMKPNTPIASIVYQGHIHTNTLHKAGVMNDLKMKIANQTKFFLDSIENGEFKLPPHLRNAFQNKMNITSAGAG